MNRIAPLLFALALIMPIGIPTAVAALAAAQATPAPSADSAIAWEPCPLPEAATPVPAPPRMAGTVDEPTVK